MCGVFVRQFPLAPWRMSEAAGVAGVASALGGWGSDGGGEGERGRAVVRGGGDSRFGLVSKAVRTGVLRGRLSGGREDLSLA